METLKVFQRNALLERLNGLGRTLNKWFWVAPSPEEPFICSLVIGLLKAKTFVTPSGIKSGLSIS